MKKKNMLSLLLAGIILLPSCSGSNPETDSTAQNTAPAEPLETAAETEPLYYDTQGADYAGYTFKIWDYDSVGVNGWSGIPSEMSVEDLTGDLLNDAVYNRNIAVEDKLNLSIQVQLVNDSLVDDLSKLVAAGDQGLDLIFPLQNHVASLLSKNTVLDVLSLESFDFSEPWWNQNCNDSMIIQNKLFTIVSDATYFDKLCTIVVYYNQEMVTDHNMGDLYSMVEEGEWTLDRICELGEYVSADIDGNSVYDENDAYGISCQNDAAYYFLHGFGQTICAEDAEGNLFFALTSEEAVDALQSIYTLMGDSKNFYNRQTFGMSLTDAINMFIEERSLFLIRPLQSLFIMRDMDANFGIIPLPKYSTEQNGYHSAVNPWGATIAMLPMTSEDAERSAVVLSTLACESHYTVISNLYETVLGEKLIRDTKSKVMLDIIFDGLVLDTGMLWNFAGIRDKLLSHQSSDVSSMLASMSTSVDRAIETFHETLNEMD